MRSFCYVACCVIQANCQSNSKSTHVITIINIKCMCDAANMIADRPLHAYTFKFNLMCNKSIPYALNQNEIIGKILSFKLVCAVIS